MTEVIDTACLTDTDQRRRALKRILKMIKDQNEEPANRLVGYTVAAGENAVLEFEEEP